MVTQIDVQTDMDGWTDGWMTKLHERADWWYSMLASGVGVRVVVCVVVEIVPGSG